MFLDIVLNILYRYKIEKEVGEVGRRRHKGQKGKSNRNW